MNSAPRLDSLTGLRFVAALGVAFAHLPFLHTPDRVGRILAEGGIGVPFFFILSGFVLTLAYRERLATPTRSGWKTYFVSRIARVWPLHLLTLALALAWPVGPQPYLFGPTVANAFLVHTWIPDARYIQSCNSVSWTLAIEAFFYLALPPLLAILSRWRSATTGQLILAAVAVWAVQYAWVAGLQSNTDLRSLYLATLCPAVRIGEFIVGILLALAHARSPACPPTRRWLWTGIELSLAIAVFVLMARSDRTHPFLRSSVYYVPALAAVVAVFARSRGWLSALLATRLPVFLGEVSFAFFLVHPFAFVYIGHHHALRYGPAICAAVSLTSALVAAIALNRLVERPMRTALPHWLEKIASRIEKGSEQIAGAVISASRQPTCDRRRRAIPRYGAPLSK